MQVVTTPVHTYVSVIDEVEVEGDVLCFSYEILFAVLLLCVGVLCRRKYYVKINRRIICACPEFRLYVLLLLGIFCQLFVVKGVSVHMWVYVIRKCHQSTHSINWNNRNVPPVMMTAYEDTYSDDDDVNSVLKCMPPSALCAMMMLMVHDDDTDDEFKERRRSLRTCWMELFVQTQTHINRIVGWF